MNDEPPDFAEELRGDDEVPMNAISGGGRVTSWFDHVINGLTLAGICALVGVTWKVSDTVTELKTLVTLKAQQYDRDIVRIDKSLERYDQRLTNLERSESTRFADPDDRQKRQ